MTGKQKTTGGKRQAAAAVALADASLADHAVAAEAVVLTLPADCRIAAQAALKDVLIGALGAGNVMLDGGEVEHADTAALQLLMLFQRELKARGGTSGWRGTSDALNNAAGLLGLSQTLELPAAALA
jgi:anti-anti-sigma regulatory factor